MTKFKNTYRIESNRYPYWDYSSSGYYFITICTRNRDCIFGDIRDGEMVLSDIGNIVKNELLNMPNYQSQVQLDSWVVMPNHVHMIIEINAPVSAAIPIPPKSTQPPSHWWQQPDYQPTVDDIKQYRKYRRSMIIPKIIGKFKMQTSKYINIQNNTPKGTIWQANYHDHIIRRDTSYRNISQYIMENPKRWEQDRFNPG